MVKPKGNTKTGKDRTVKVGYKKEYCQIFIDLCNQGLLLTQIAHAMDLPRGKLLEWSKDKTRKYEFTRAWEKGMQACQAFHETRLQKMITGEIRADSKSKDLQRDLLRVRFKEDWSDNKQEIKIESVYNRMSDDELTNQLLNSTQRPNTRKLLDSTVELLLVKNNKNGKTD